MWCDRTEEEHPMPLRLLELTLPRTDLAGLPAQLADHGLTHVSTTEHTQARGTARFLLDSGKVEPVSDALFERFGTRDGFRIVLLPVEATVPRVEEPEESPASQDEEPSDGDRHQRLSREELYQDLVSASRITLVYAVMIALSAVVAAVGLVRGEVAIVIGAMVIAPLLGPNVALALACALGDLALARRSLSAIGLGLAIAAVLSLALGVVVPVDPATPELAARTTPDFADIALALAAGTAGSLAFTSGVPAVLVGVMVAVALLPPLVAAGLLAGSGHGALAAGAVTLLLTNVACVNLAAVATFLVQKVRPRTWWETERAKRATRLAVTSWIVLLLVLLGAMLVL